jgi:hypothetical protein
LYRWREFYEASLKLPQNDAFEKERSEKFIEKKMERVALSVILWL